MSGRSGSNRKLITYIFGGFMVLTLAVSSFASLGGINLDDNDPVNNVADNVIDQEDQPARHPVPNASLSISRSVINVTGLFEMPLPDGDWAVTRTTSSDGNSYDINRNRADIIIASNQRGIIVQAFANIGINYEDTESLSENYLTDSEVLSGWSSGYTSVSIRERDVNETFVTIDFDLSTGELVYFARQISWQSQGILMTLRIVIPDNNFPVLEPIQINFLEQMALYPSALNTPLQGWEARTDLIEDFFVKVPSTWQEISGGDGEITTYGPSEGDDLLVTVQHIEGQSVNTLEAAQQFVTEFRDDVRIIDFVETDKFFSDGYIISYSFPTPDGDRISAAMALYNNQDGLSIAEARLAESGIDILAQNDGDEMALMAKNIVSSFTIKAPPDFVYLGQPGGSIDSE